MGRGQQIECKLRVTFRLWNWHAWGPILPWIYRHDKLIYGSGFLFAWKRRKPVYIAWHCRSDLNEKCTFYCRLFSTGVTKFKLQNYWSFWYFMLMMYKSSWKTIIRTNFRSEWVLGFVIDYAQLPKLLRDAAFTWRLSWLKRVLKSVETYFGEFGYLNSSCIGKSIILMFLSSSRDKFTLL